MNQNDLQEKFNGRSVLVTGGLGFIGSSLSKKLVELGAKVTILDALLEPYGGNKFNIADIEDKVELVNGNILDEELISKLVTGTDYIFHLAGQVGYLDAKRKPFVDLEFNGRGNLIMLEAIKENAPDARILFSSSRLIYGKIKKIPVKESHQTEPLSLYGIHKLLGEKYYAYYAHNFGVHGMSMRIPNPYGPKQQMKHSKYSIVGWFIRQAMEGKTIDIFGDGKQVRDYIYIDDIVDAMLHLIVNGDDGEAYNIGSGSKVTFTDMVDEVIKAVGQGDKRYVDWPEDYEKNETGNYLADTKKIDKATNWKPQVSLEDGLKKTVEFYTKNKEFYW
jgi:UDP-glucose 4-epimerase